VALKRIEIKHVLSNHRVDGYDEFHGYLGGAMLGTDFMNADRSIVCSQ
jgi:hypothetical protein